MRLATSLHEQQKSIITKNTSNMEKTSIAELLRFINNDRMQSSYTKEQLIELLNFKLEKEKEQIVQAFNHGRNVGSVGSQNVDGNYYYEQIFKSE